MSANTTPSHQLVNLQRYPIDNLNTSKGRSFVESCRRDLADTNVCVLPEFVPAKVIAKMAAEAEEMMPQAHYRVHDWNCYISREDDRSFPDDHPRRRFFADKSKIIAFDLFGPDSTLRHFYYTESLAPALAAILGYEKLFHNDCPFQALTTLGFDEADSSCWHFDKENEFTITIQMQNAERGGQFEIVPDVRSQLDENYSGVQRVLDGDRDGVRSYSLDAGTLTIFRGRDSLHRVTKIEGTRRRLVGVMCFEQRPGVISSAEMNATIFGSRVAALVGL